jgi:hypothetical protein
MSYALSKFREIRAAIVAELSGLSELPGGVHDARVKPFSESIDEYPVASVFTGNDSAEYSPDDANLRRDYDVDIVVISKGYDVADIASADDSFIEACDIATAAIENALTKFRFTLDGLIYRLTYRRSSQVIDEDGEYFTCIRILTYNAHSIEKVVNANV